MYLPPPSPFNNTLYPASYTWFYLGESWTFTPMWLSFPWGKTGQWILHCALETVERKAAVIFFLTFYKQTHWKLDSHFSEINTGFFLCTQLSNSQNCNTFARIWQGDISLELHSNVGFFEERASMAHVSLMSSAHWAEVSVEDWGISSLCFAVVCLQGKYSVRFARLQAC